MLKKLFCIVFLLLCGCAETSLYIPMSFQYRELPSEYFTLASWQKITDATSSVKIYIEGDGAAFNAHGYPTSNPTPRGKLLREIAFADYNPNVVYLGRPCQYVKDSKCQQKYWTTARFSEEVVQSTAEAIKHIAKNREVILIGFSGGAEVAGLVAVKNPNIKVKKLITIGGNLNHRVWTTHHRLPDLKDSMDLADYREQYLLISQTHYVGTKDEIIPMFITKDFTDGKNIVEVKGATHNAGWNDIYPKIWAEN